jgi:hypothetical protein
MVPGRPLSALLKHGWLPLNRTEHGIQTSIRPLPRTKKPSCTLYHSTVTAIVAKKSANKMPRFPRIPGWMIPRFPAYSLLIFWKKLGIWGKLLEFCNPSYSTDYTGSDP